MAKKNVDAITAIKENRVIFNPYTGTNLDFDSVPIFCPLNQKPGRYCPTTGRPLDKIALQHYAYRFGNDEIKRNMAEADKTAVENIESQLVMKTPETEK